MTFEERAKRVRLLALDVDGVLTDGRLIYGPEGEKTKVFHVHDGLALVAARRAGVKVVIITSRSSEAVAIRMSELGVDVLLQGVSDKRASCEGLLPQFGVSATEVAYMGDDLPDLPVLRLVGLAIAPANAAPEVKALAHLVTERAGGEGAVREAVCKILASQGKWEGAIIE